LDEGADAFRVDATPYLFEREGANGENLPETHAYLKRLRAFVDAYAPGTMLLSEANMWPEDVRPYLGGDPADPGVPGDEFHMNFHFPLMPRIFMALAKADRTPIEQILARTPPIPANCQWGTFLRCHDELTLEMVTPEERRFMWDFYAPEPRMRLNMGIRRRLAPLLGNDQARIELANSLLLTLTGSPVLYYGDEIGMGDNIWLDDRDGVRTPMQWSDAPNAGFSTVDPSRLGDPVIDDSVFGYRKVNVDAQRADPGSWLNRMREMLAVRKTCRSFGCGELQLLAPAGVAVLAYLRTYGDEVILVVNNLSPERQHVEIDLGAFAGARPVDLFTGQAMPLVTEEAYRVALGRYGYHWLRLR
jgi:maltose alpha-D-glucosyltransferase/alpha-amylase